MGVLTLVIRRGDLFALKGAGVFVAALIPFGGLWLHRMLARTVAIYGGH